MSTRDLTYEPLNRNKRAAALRLAARECAAAGFHVFAQVNNEMADFLDPKEPDAEMHPDAKQK